MCIFSKIYGFLRCTALGFLILFGAAKCFAFSHPIDIEYIHEFEHQESEQKARDRENERAFERYEKGSQDARDREGALEHIHDIFEKLAVNTEGTDSLREEMLSRDLRRDDLNRVSFLKVIYGEASIEDVKRAYEWILDKFPEAAQAFKFFVMSRY